MPPDGEEALVGWLRQRAPRVGDDCALVVAEGEAPRLAITTDSQIEGVHFRSGLDPRWIARRLVRVNLSDLASVGARPLWLTSNVNAPSEFDHRRFLSGVLDDCEQFGIELVGGDVARSSLLQTTATAIGDYPDHRQPLRRDAGRVGDQLYLGGTVGVAGLGLWFQDQGVRLENDRVALPTRFDSLGPRMREAAREAVRRHRLPEPQLELGAALAARQRAAAPIAAIDLSDGLLKDLARLARASGVNAELDLDLLPIPTEMRELASAVEIDDLSLALSSGEDYVLLFSLPPGADVPAGFQCRRVGRLVDGDEGESVRLHRGGKAVSAADLGLPGEGFDHLATS